MSSIWGFFSKKVSDENIEQLRAWNRAYGKEEAMISEQEFCVGSFFDAFSSKCDSKCSLINNDEYAGGSDSLIYNRNEIEKEYSFCSDKSDNEFLIEFVIKFGFDALKKVNGDFSGFLFDKKKNVLTLFKDHLGIRPLFFYFDGTSLAFSSDIRGLISQKNLDDSISDSYFYKVLKGYSTLSYEETDFKYIFKVNHGSYISFAFANNRINMKKKSYWSVKKRKVEHMNREGYALRLRELIEDSLKRRMDVIPGTLGCEFSGGLDSSVLSVLIKRMNRDCAYYSWSHSPEDVPYAEDDERLRIKDICDAEGITCYFRGMQTEGFMDEDSILAYNMKKIGFSIDDERQIKSGFVLPNGYNSPTITAASYTLNKHGASVIFSGHGGDEGVSHRGNSFEMFYEREFLQYFKHFLLLTKGQEHSKRRAVKLILKNIKSSVSILGSTTQNYIVPDKLILEKVEEKVKGIKLNKKVFEFNTIRNINNGALENRLFNTAFQGGYSSMRYIFPYLDYRVLEYAVSIPRYVYLKGNLKRNVYREAFKDVLPESVLTYKGKEDTSTRMYNKIVKSENGEFDISKYYSELFKVYIDFLDKELWCNYLNYDELYKWADKKYDNDEDLEKAGGLINILNYCATIDNLRKKAPVARIIND